MTFARLAPPAGYTCPVSGYLQRLVDYNNWANRELLVSVERLPPDTLDLSARGVYGSIRQTLAHMLSSELSYERHFLGGPLDDLSEQLAQAQLPFLQGLAARSAANLEMLAQSLPEPATVLALRDGKRAAATVLTQLFVHGCEHRAHVGTILGANGIEPPDLDSWAYGIFVGGDDWPSEWGPEPVVRAR